MASSDIAHQRVLGVNDAVQWGSSLIAVLALFFFCTWCVRKLSTRQVNLQKEEEMSVLGSLAIGSKERVVLLKLGRKQLLLAVGAGHTEMLCLLEGDDCLQLDSHQFSAGQDGIFAQKLMQVMKENVSR